MRFDELIVAAGLDPGRLPSQAADIEISGLAYSSQSVTPGALFFCVKGATSDGHDYAADAAGRGAVALVCERPLDVELPQLLVGDSRAAMAPIAAGYYGDPSASLRMIGVTGTNGKTTTAFQVRHILEHGGVATGLLGTVQSVVGGDVREVERTTPEAIDLQATFREMVDAGDRACAMEVSSHALELHRADAIAFDCVVFTNLTQDHLDFHGTLDHYFGAKRSLFIPHEEGRRPGASVVNLDDEWGRKLAGELGETGQTTLITFAVGNDADYRAENVETSWQGSSFDLVMAGHNLHVDLPQPGLFNVYNAVAAIAACACIGIDPVDAAIALRDSPPVPGRLETIDEGQPFGVLVDYAHTPDSLENVLRCARELLESGTARDGRLICVFGAGGDRDTGKRPQMGELARALGDLVYVTSDNPRSEDPESIIEQIVAGAERVSDQEPPPLRVEPDRRVAIEQALAEAREGDLVVIAGKGHEQGQEFAGGKKIPFDDREVAREALRG